MFTCEQWDDLLARSKEKAQKIEELDNQFLTSNEWELRNDIPGKIWLWQKKLDDGRIIAVPKSLAITIQTDLSR